MTNRKYIVNYFTLAANANQQQFSFVTPDDPVARTVLEVYCGVIASGLEVDILTVGQLEASFDTTRFANGNKPVDVNISVPATIPLTIQFVDRPAPGRTNVPIVIGYETS